MKINKEQRQVEINKAYEMRLQGKSFRTIGEALGVSHVTAQHWVKDHLEAVTLPLVDEVRKTELDRLMRMLDALEDDAVSGDPKAVGLVIKISERLCKMLGVDRPTQIEVSSTADQLDLAIVDLISSQKARNAMAKAEAAQKASTDDEASVALNDLNSNEEGE